MPSSPTPVPPEGVTVRSASWEDLDAVTELLAAASQARIGAVTVRREDLRLRWLGLDSLDAVVLLEDPASPQRLVAFSAEDILDDPDSGTVELHVEGQVHPAHTGRGAASYLLDRAAADAHAAATALDRDEVTLRTTLVDGDEGARSFFEHRGFSCVRYLLELRLDLHARPPAPIWPGRVDVRLFDPERDVDLAWQAHQAAFADVPTHLPLTLEDFRTSRLSGSAAIDPSLSLLAEEDGEVVGLALCRAGAPGASEDGWIRDFGVVPAHRRRGVGMALLRATFGRFRAHDLSGVALEVDDVTLDGAVALYRRAGMRIVHRTDVLERSLPVRGG